MTLTLKLPARDPHGHKGTFGTVAIVGGCADSRSRMIGAPAIAALAALRAGAGLARVLCPGPILNEVIQITPSATGVALPARTDEPPGALIPHEAAEIFDIYSQGADAIVIGTGLGWAADPLDPLAEGTRAIVLRAILHADVPLVVDADALTALASTPDFARDFRAAAILTPHPGEHKRLATALSLPLAGEDDASRLAACESLARRVGCIVILKGAGTVVSDGQQSWKCDHGHACLATAGTGDVLSGLLGGLLAQYSKPTARPRLSLFEVACLGVQAHAMAGEMWSKQHAQAGLVAHELADLLPAALDKLRR
ncbi:MAG: NAD(P)H-hydrate dehydratase [Phycisphaeraceae bacterium]|nr:NAD(P)H-hydrate dehydratase [Phycisphaeraceae bacterium]